MPSFKTTPRSTRFPYYEKYADITLDETGKEFGELVDELRAYFENLEK